MAGLALARVLDTPRVVIGPRIAAVPPPRPVYADGVDGDTLAALMAAVAGERDRQAFGELFDHFAPRITAYLRRLGAQTPVAEDLLQEVMLTVWRRAEQFDPAKAGVSTWVFTIARNKRIDAVRRERRPAFDPSDPSFVPEQAPDAADAVEQSERGAMLRSAMADLPAEQGRLLELAFMEDMSHRVIAEKLDLPLGTVKSRIRLAMRKLRRQLESIQ